MLNKIELKKPLSLAVGIALSPAVFASTVAAPSSANQTSEGGLDFILEEIVITAQKRAESLQDVPISVSAISGDKIANAGIADLEGVSAYIPNFSVQKDPIGDKINIRGIQSGNQAGFEQSVSTFVDGVFRGRAVQSRFAFLDTEMVEILRGPQGTLFGKNTIGGALNIRSARPTDELEAQVSAQYNIDFEETELRGYISGPLSHNVRARAAFVNRAMDEGWGENKFYADDTPDTDEQAARISLEWDATDDTTVQFKYEHGKWDNRGQPWDLITTGNLLSSIGLEGNTDYKTNAGNGAAFMESVFGPGSAGNTEPMDFGSNALFKGDLDETAITVETEYSRGLLTAIFAHSAYDFNRDLDADFNPLPILRFDDSEDYEQNSFEMRFASDTGGDIEYIAGLYYQESDLYADGLTHYNIDALGVISDAACGSGGGTMVAAGGDLDGDGLITGNDDAVATLAANAGGVDAATARACVLGQLSSNMPNFNRHHFLDQESETWAAFGQVTWHITNEFRATLGLRYTEEEKQATQSAYATEYAAGIGTRNDSTPYAFALSVIGEGVAHEHEMERDEESLTWSLNLQYDLSADAMAYVTASTGFKAGGFNSFTIVDDIGDAEFEEEEVLSAEIGTKMTLDDGRAELNMAYFYTQYDNLQTSLFTGSTTFIVQNAAEAITQGIEIDGRWQATEKLLLQGSLGWVNFEFDEFPTAACNVQQLLGLRESEWNSGNISAPLLSLQDCSARQLNDLAGETSENTPEFSANLMGTYTHPLDAGLELNLAVDINYMDEQYRQADLDPALKDDAVTKVNAALTFGRSDGQWDVSLIAKNITDETSISYGNDSPLFDLSRQVTLDAPRSFTIRGRMHF